VSRFQVFFNRKAERSLFRLPKTVLASVYELVYILEEDPIPWRAWDIKSLKGRSNAYRVRLGKYRLIYNLYLDRKEIVIQKISVRGKAYSD
jgi:mRNA interferase RelE/StbE